MGHKLKLEGGYKIVCRFLEGVCLLVVCLHLLLLLLLNDLPHLLLQLWGNDELIIWVWLCRCIEVAPLFPDRGICCLLNEILAPGLAGHRAICPSSPSQSARPGLSAEAGRGWGHRGVGDQWRLLM